MRKVARQSAVAASTVQRLRFTSGQLRCLPAKKKEKDNCFKPAPQTNWSGSAETGGHAEMFPPAMVVGREAANK